MHRQLYECLDLGIQEHGGCCCSSDPCRQRVARSWRGKRVGVYSVHDTTMYYNVCTMESSPSSAATFHAAAQDFSRRHLRAVGWWSPGQFRKLTLGCAGWYRMTVLARMLTGSETPGQNDNLAKRGISKRKTMVNRTCTFNARQNDGAAKIDGGGGGEQEYSKRPASAFNWIGTEYLSTYLGTYFTFPTTMYLGSKMNGGVRARALGPCTQFSTDRQTSQLKFLTSAGAREKKKTFYTFCFHTNHITASLSLTATDLQRLSRSRLIDLASRSFCWLLFLHMLQQHIDGGKS